VQQEDLSAYVYKIEHNAKGNNQTYLKILGGNLKIRRQYHINDSESLIKFRNLKTVKQGIVVETNEVIRNDIAILCNVQELCIGDYLGIKPALVQALDIPSPALKSSIFPVNMEERSKLISALTFLNIEDPSLDFVINEQNNDLEVNLYGLTQREVILSFLEERFKIQASFDEVKTIYKERPKRHVEKTIPIEVPPNPYWASIGLTIEPLAIGSGLQIESNISLGYLNHSFQNAVFDGIRKACQSGLYGWEVTDLKVVFSYGFYYSPVSTPADFRQLAPYVFRLALQESGVDILEPVLRFNLEIPQHAHSRAIIDLQKMHGNITHINNNQEWVSIEGEIPLDTSKEYPVEVKAYTQGIGVFVTEPLDYRITKNGMANSQKRVEKDKLFFMFEKMK
jgi:ribosomal protection tetracycline resistance protein